MLKTLVCATVVAHLILTSSAASHNAQIIEADLKSYSPYDNKNNVFKYRDILTEGLAEIHVKGVPESVGFFVVQMHTYLYPVVLSTTKNASSNSISGTNIGLVQITNGSAVYKFFAVSDPSLKISSLIFVVIYDKQAPIPGGCNLSFKTEIAPYQLVKLVNEMVMVDSQAPSIPGTRCERAHASIEFYHLYLNEHDYDKETYFDGVSKMLTVDAIRTYGNKIPANPDTPFKNYYSAYRGVGAVFGVIATFKNESSAYVPAVSYACDALNWDADCNGPITLQWKFMCAVLLFCGFFLCFLGHRFFRVTLFMFGFTVGACITYVALVAGYDLSFEDSTLTALGFGAIYGAFWLFLWWRFGVPVLSIFLAFITTGTLVTCILFYSRVQDMGAFRSNPIYWVLTVLIVLGYTTIMCTMISALGHIISCSLLGSFAFIAALSHYVGANLQYIVVNMFRRTTVENFDLAMVDPPYQVKDINLTITWILFLLCGIYCQIWFQRGKPPFPPHRPLLFEHQSESTRERTPLLFNMPPGVVYTTH